MSLKKEKDWLDTSVSFFGPLPVNAFIILSRDSINFDIKILVIGIMLFATSLAIYGIIFPTRQ